MFITQEENNWPKNDLTQTSYVQQVFTKPNFIGHKNVILFAELSNCVSGHCSHPRSMYWVQCGRCDLWYHCRCVEILPQKARQPDFSFICCLWQFNHFFVE